MRPYLDEAFGNPSSGHWASMPAKAALEKARSQVAVLLDCAPDEVVFTSGGSEANNLAIKGTFFALRHKGEHIVTTTVEHPAILAPCRFLEQLGAAVTYVPVDSTGRVDPEDVRRAVTPRTILISVMHANNEVGTIHRRAGTESALLAVGLGAACALAGDLEPMARVRVLRDRTRCRRVSATVSHSTGTLSTAFPTRSAFRSSA